MNNRKTIICPNCSEENNSSFRYCYQCGRKLIDEGESISEIPTQEQTPLEVLIETDDHSSQARKVNLKIIFFVVVLISLCVVIFGLRLLTHSSSSLGQNYSTTSQFISQTQLVSPVPSATLFPISLDVLKPQNSNDLTDGDSYNISIRTTGNSIFINGEKISKVSIANGFASFSVKLSSGVNIFIIKVLDQYGQSLEKTVRIERLLPFALLSLSDKLPYSTQGKQIAISGSTEPGAELVLTTSLIYKTPIQIDSNGNFAIVLSLPVIPGKYPVDIAATCYNHRDSTKSIEIEKILDENEYKNAAIAVNYKELLSNPMQFEGKVIKLSGIIDSIPDLSSAKNFLFRFNGRKSQMVFIEYLGNTSIIKGANRLLYGEYSGAYNGLPKIVARLAYKVTPTIEYIP